MSTSADKRHDEAVDGKRGRWAGSPRLGAQRDGGRGAMSARADRGGAGESMAGNPIMASPPRWHRRWAQGDHGGGLGHGGDGKHHGDAGT